MVAKGEPTVKKEFVTSALKKLSIERPFDSFVRDEPDACYKYVNCKRYACIDK
jgi:hypothetical protein